MAVDNGILLAGPLETAQRLVSLLGEGSFFLTVGKSLLRMALGFAAGFLAAVLLAVGSRRFPLLEEALAPVMALLKAVPVASFVVLLLVWWGSSFLAVAVCFLVVLPNLYVNTLEGLKSADSRMLEMARVFRMPVWNRFFYIYRPALRPFLDSGMKISLGMCWKSGVAAEVIGMPDFSIGGRIYLSKVYLDTAGVLAWTAVVIVLSVLFEKLVRRLLDLFFAWEPACRRPRIQGESAEGRSGRGTSRSRRNGTGTRTVEREGTRAEEPERKGTGTRTVERESARAEEPERKGTGTRTVERESARAEEREGKGTGARTVERESARAEEPERKGTGTRTIERESARAEEPERKGTGTRTVEREVARAEEPERKGTGIRTAESEAARAEAAEAERGNQESRNCQGKGAAIELTGIAKSYDGQPVLKDFYAVYEKGETYYLTSPSGSGKTTLLHILAGLIRPDAGQVSPVPVCSMVFQEDRLCEDYSAVKNVELVTGDAARAGEVLRQLLGEEALHKPCRQLSGGMRRRVALVRAMEARSDCVLLDEPFTGMDRETRSLAENYLLKNQKGRTLIIATHR